MSSFLFVVFELQKKNYHKSFYMTCYKYRSSVEAKTGRQSKGRMSPAKVNRLRVLSLTGKADLNNEKRAKQCADRSKKSVERLWEAFYEYKSSNRSINDERN